MNHFKKYLLGFLFTVITFLTIVSANASVLLEPTLGINISGSGNDGTAEIKYSGLQLGARFGYQEIGFMGGLAFNSASFTYESTTSGVITERDKDKTDIGFFFGYNAPIFFRAWLTYYTSTKMTDADSSNKKGSTTEIGVGYTGIPMLSINLIYRMVSFDKETSSAGTITTREPSLDLKEIVLGVSLPFTLF